MPEGSQVKSMFGRIAGGYDLANRCLSFGVDKRWRRRLVKLVMERKPKLVVDLATGSGDVALALNKAIPEGGGVIGMDFCEPMLKEAREKANKRGVGERVSFEYGDCMELPLEDGSVDALTIAFGFRNFEDRERGLKEMLRVLRPGGALYILEFSQPASWMRPFYYFYLKKLLPFLAGMLTGDRGAYCYLGDSIESFPGREALAEEIRGAGFEEVTAEAMTGGIVAIHRGVK